jgi:hypothetical protein
MFRRRIIGLGSLFLWFGIRLCGIVRALYQWRMCGVRANLVVQTATAVQHVCLAKALMLIREYEVYDYTMEQRAKVKV